MKIESLTPEQEAELPAFRQRYLDIATTGARADRPALESALAAAYAEIGKPTPKLFLFDSPAECMLAIKIFQMGDGANLGANLWDNLWDNLRANLGANLDAKPVEPEDGQLIITHSETGHHHVILERPDVRQFAGMDIFRGFLEVAGDAAAELVHLREHHTHAPQFIEPGAWLIQRQAAYTPQGWERARD